MDPGEDATRPQVRPAVDAKDDDETEVRPRATDLGTATTVGLPSVAASPGVFPPLPPPRRRPRRGRLAALTAVTVLALVLVLGAGALVGRLTAPRTTIAAAPTVPASTGQSPTGPPFAPPPASVPAGPTRPSDALAPWAARINAAVDVPQVAAQAYGYAQLLLQNSNPSCHLGWTTLAGIGEVATHHGQQGGAVLDRSGRTTPTIVGPSLDGRDGRPLVRDTDAGAFDADPTYDRAMGPMQVLPAVWRTYASDGDNDQIQDPYDIDDSTVAVARLLCSGNADLAQLTGWTAAIAKFQSGDAFANAVFQAADGYGQRTRNVQ
jgi:membrane-bound lytic murein transglycosylase B